MSNAGECVSLLIGLFSIFYLTARTIREQKRADDMTERAANAEVDLAIVTAERDSLSNLLRNIINNGYVVTNEDRGL